jgi:hypothetical protein
MDIDRYCWQEHAPQPGRWKADLIVTAFFVAIVGATHVADRMEPAQGPIASAAAEIRATGEPHAAAPKPVGLPADPRPAAAPRMAACPPARRTS